MDADLAPVHRQVVEAEHPEELFGSEDIVLPASFLLKFLLERYNKLAVVCDPTKYTDLEDTEAAEEAAAKLKALYATATARMRRGHYGFSGFNAPLPRSSSKSFTVGERTYHIGSKLYDGDTTATYQAFLEAEGLNIGEVVVRLAKQPEHNHVVDSEARNLFLLHSVEVPQWKHLPMLLDTFHSSGRMGIVSRKLVGYTLAEVHKHRRHAAGVDQKHVAWMLDRLFSCLGFVHSRVIVHGALSPDSVRIEAANHNALIGAWEFACINPARSAEKVNVDEIIASGNEVFAAPEVLERGEIGPWSDIYSTGKLMIWLLGGDPETDELPPQVEPAVAGFLKKLVTPSRHGRPSDAWELYAEQCAIKDALWPRKFLHFDMS